MTEYYAHSLEGKLPEEWQLLDEHLNNVAEMARSFAEEFGAGDWAYMVGLKKIYAHSLEANLRRNGRGWRNTRKTWLNWKESLSMCSGRAVGFVIKIAT